MVVSILRAGPLFRWIAVVGNRANGDVATTWDEALEAATRAVEQMKGQKRRDAMKGPWRPPRHKKSRNKRPALNLIIHHAINLIQVF